LTVLGEPQKIPDRSNSPVRKRQRQSPHRDDVNGRKSSREENGDKRSRSHRSPSKRSRSISPKSPATKSPSSNLERSRSGSFSRSKSGKTMYSLSLDYDRPRSRDELRTSVVGSPSRKSEDSKPNTPRIYPISLQLEKFKVTSTLENGKDISSSEWWAKGSQFKKQAGTLKDMDFKSTIYLSASILCYLTSIYHTVQIPF
jgi:hypothetical protein